MGEIGYTLTLSILWDTTYVTADVNVVKVSCFARMPGGDLFAHCFTGRACYRLQLLCQGSVVLQEGLGPWLIFIPGDKFASFMNSVLGTGVFNSDGACLPLANVLSSLMRCPR